MQMGPKGNIRTMKGKNQEGKMYLLGNLNLCAAFISTSRVIVTFNHSANCTSKNFQLSAFKLERSLKYLLLL